MKTIPTARHLYAVAVLSLLFCFTACKKEGSSSGLSPREEEQAVLASSESEAEADAMTNDIFDDVMGVSAEVGLGGTGIFGRTGSTTSRVDSLPTCATVSFTQLNAPELFPLRVVINFGSGCLGHDGRTRSGKIITVYTGRLTVPGKSASTTFDAYKVDSISVEGTHKVTNASTSNERIFNIDVVNGKRTRPSGNYVQWNSHREVRQIEGLGTPLFPLDDVFLINGHSSGVVKRSNMVTLWESKILEALNKRFTCRWISKGVARTIRKNSSSSSPWIALLNYGNGDCDNKATLTVNGTTHQITLH